jgi:hypothetical protein
LNYSRAILECNTCLYIFNCYKKRNLDFFQAILKLRFLQQKYFKMNLHWNPSSAWSIQASVLELKGQTKSKGKSVCIESFSTAPTLIDFFRSFFSFFSSNLQKSCVESVETCSGIYSWTCLFSGVNRKIGNKMQPLSNNEQENYETLISPNPEL